jgi:hypothetical protein
MMTPTRHRKKVPLQELRKNPFSSRNAYPSLDQAFQTTNCQNSSFCFSPDRTSSIGAASELDLSIGARADLYEHQRHIMKYGLDHDGQTYQDDCKSSTVDDDDWEQIMDGNTSHISYSSAFILESNLLSFSKGESYTGNRYYIDGSSDVDADTTIHSDYFNSSKVLKLYTPEKNRRKIDEASRLSRLEFVGIVDQEADHHDNSHYCDESSTLDESGGMVKLFQAAMKIGLEESHKIHEDEHLENEEEEERAESFISYQEPNLSVANFDGTETSSNFNQDNDSDFHGSFENCDVHTSLISYRDPNLSVSYGRSGTAVESSISHADQCHPSNDAESEFSSRFEVNISKINEPGGEIEITVSPVMKRNATNSLKSSGLPRSGSKYLPKSLRTPIRAKNTPPSQTIINTPGSTSSMRYKNHSSIRWPDEYSPTNLSTASMTRLRDVQTFYSSGKGSSPVKSIANKVKTEERASERDAEDEKLHCNPMNLRTNTLSLSPIEWNDSSKKSQSKTNCKRISNSKPKRMTLRDRYTSPERFEDNFSVPSSTSTSNSCPQSISDDSPVNRSLLESFETAFYSRVPRFEM